MGAPLRERPFTRLERGFGRKGRKTASGVECIHQTRSGSRGEVDGLWTEYVQMREKKKLDVFVDMPGC